MGISDVDTVEHFVNWSEEETKTFIDYCHVHSPEGALSLESIEEVLPYKLPIQICHSFPLVMEVLVKGCQIPRQQELMEEAYIFKRYQITKYQQAWTKKEATTLRHYILTHTNVSGDVNW